MIRIFGFLAVLAVLSTVIAASSSAIAHEFWIAPSRHTVETGEPIVGEFEASRQGAGCARCCHPGGQIAPHEFGQRPGQEVIARIDNYGKQARQLVGLRLDDASGVAPGDEVTAAGRVVGEVTSGVLSPTLGIPIAMAYADPDAAEIGTELALDVRGTAIPARVVPLPFYSRKATS